MHTSRSVVSFIVAVAVAVAGACARPADCIAVGVAKCLVIVQRFIS